jgi:multidrug efflux system outer membrane protein
MHPLAPHNNLIASKVKPLVLMVKLIALAVVLLLSACTKPKEFVRPDAPVPLQWPATPDVKGREEATKIHWKTYFKDPRLQALIQASLQYNRDMRIAAARVEEARAQYAIVRADQLPVVNLLGSATYTGTPNDLVNAGTPSSYRRYDANITSVSYEVDFWGRLSKLSEAAKNNFLSSQEAQRAFQLSLISEVANTYFSLLQFDELISLARETMASREVSLGVVGKGRDLGGSYDFEVEQARSTLEASRSTLDSLEHQRTITQNRLNYLVGDTPRALPKGLTLSQQGLDGDLTPGLPSEILLLRPDVMAAEQRLRAAHANIDAARSAFLPKVMLTAGVGVASQGLSTLFSGSAWNFVPSLTVPIFNGGKLAASVDLAEVRKVIAVADYEKTIQLAFREVADLLSARTSLSKQVFSAQLNEKAQLKRLEIATARNKVGLTGYLEVLDSQRDVVSAQLGTTQVRRAQLEASAQLYKALGGGT